jgi:hypothetical protein
MFILDTRLIWLIFTFEFIRHPIPPILSPSSCTFVELTLITNYIKDQQVVIDIIRERLKIAQSRQKSYADL